MPHRRPRIFLSLIVQWPRTSILRLINAISPDTPTGELLTSVTLHNITVCQQPARVNNEETTTNDRPQLFGFNIEQDRITQAILLNPCFRFRWLFHLVVLHVVFLTSSQRNLWRYSQEAFRLNSSPCLTLCMRIFALERPPTGVRK